VIFPALSVLLVGIIIPLIPYTIMTLFIGETDTIIALSSGQGPSAISVIRLSGKDSLSIAKKFLKTSKGNPISLKDRMATLLSIKDSNKTIDKSVVTYFKAPKTFTGEDMVEISAHGSPFIVRKVMDLALKNGARTARPGEFSMRAFLNDKMDLAQAEGLCDLISSKSHSAHKAAMNLLEGKLSAEFQNIRKRIVDLLTDIEARLNDTDEDISSVNKKNLISKLKTLQKQIEHLTKTYGLNRQIKEGIRIAIVGAPNSGKSSLLNRLLGVSRAIVSPKPGTTRDTIEETFDIADTSFIITDTAGIRSHALDGAEIEGMKRTYQAVRNSDMILLMVDSSKSPGKYYKTILNTITELDKRYILVLNKYDIKSRKNTLNRKKDSLTVSCKTGIGISALKKKVLSVAKKFYNTENSCLLTSARQYDSLERAKKEINSVMDILKRNDFETEIVSFHLQTALNELEEILGETTSQDILDSVFSKFCYGK
jgi:tRNA modification GTPase